MPPEAIRLQPNHVHARHNLGLTHLILGDKNAAMEQYRALVELDQEAASDLLKRISSARD